MLTLDVGSSDEQHLIESCEENQPDEVAECLSAHSSAFIQTVKANVADTVYALRNAATVFPPSDEYVDYTGPITFVEAFDPYGHRTKSAEVPGSNELTAELNAAEKTALESEPNVCIANLQPEFNPGYGHPADEGAEATRLREWTNMENEKSSRKHKNGPDPSPTKTGYRKIAEIMKTDCPYAGFESSK